MSARFSDAEAARIDAARGSADRSVWLRRVALASLAAKEPVQVKTGARRGSKPTDAPSGPQRRRCTHSGTRVIGGFCTPCDHLVEPGGLWRE